MNSLKGITSLNNKYFILRHGQSEANVAGLITSDPAQCLSRYGLTEYGAKQVAATIRQAKLRGWLDAKTIIYCSDFKRTVETAEVARQILQAAKIHPSSALRERFFGTYDGKHVDAYIEIWEQDQAGKQEGQNNGVEGPEEMLDRLKNCIKALEAEYQNKCMLLVSHGDPLQVLQAAFAGLRSEQGRALKYIEPGELRELTLAP